MLMSKKPLCQLLNPADLQHAADQLEVPLACIQAIDEIESRGCGFLRDGHPVILFERHIMYRQLQATGHDVAVLSVRYPDIVNPQPGGYIGGVAEHQRLNSAKKLEATCAIASTSWGRFQIMGWHWQRLGYSSVAAFAGAMAESEAYQLDAFIRFIKTDRVLYQALKTQNWTAFARGYNGLAYHKNQYDLKLENAYKRYTQDNMAIKTVSVNR